MFQKETVNNNNLAGGNLHSGTAENLKIGTRLNGHPSQPGYFNGAIKNVRLYSRVLGSTEVSSNFNNNCDYEPTDTSNLVCWSKLEEGMGSIALDYSRFEVSGSFSGTGMNWGRFIRKKGCTNNEICFNQVSGKYLAGGYRFGFNGIEKDD